MNTRTAPELIPDERTRRLREAIAADPTAPVRIGIVAPGGYGKTAVLGELAAIYRAAGIRVAGVADRDTDPAGTALLVDDAHRLEPAQLHRIRGLAEAGRARVIVAARPWPAPPALAELGGALDGTTRLRPFDRAQTAAVLTAAGVSARPGLGEFVYTQTGGVPALVDRVARAMERSDQDGPPDMPAAALAELGAELEALPAEVLGFLLAADAGAGLHADLLGDVLGCDRSMVGDVARAARATGLVDHGGRLIPVVRLAIRTVIPVDRRTAVRERLAAAQLERGPAWAETVALAGDLDTALRAADQVLTTSSAPEHAHAARVAAAALAHRGQLARSAELFRWAGDGVSNAFAVLGLIGTGQPGAAEQLLGASTSDGPPTLVAGAATLMAHGMHASVRGAPAAALSTLVRAAALLEPADHVALLPDSPAALAAMAAVQCGELAVADSVLRRAVHAGMGGVPFAVRHRLLRAWVGMAGGDLTAARERLQHAVAARAAGTPSPPRDWLFAVALEVGLARRTSDLPGLRQVWARAGEAVIRHPVDLYTLLPLGEFAVAAARLGDADRLAAHVAEGWALLRRLGDPPLWTASLAWSCLHAAIVAEQWTAAEEQAARLAGLAGLPGCGRYHAVLAAAARCWLAVVGGTVDPAAVETAARDLHAAGLRWDAARLAGQAAIRTPDRKAMAGLMECARLLQGESTAVTRVHDADPQAGSRLSEREQQVARLVLAGLTYREVGDRLFISAKTVEHHIARIRQRLGSSNRRELLAQLRELLGDR
ncbi:MAG TPA: helix-turn-helix transcriptional regulator [Actinophytocola sp.]|uniref:helix-turn-helix transcriptional regulator n=1 Tax=Actinophytocola sp. TaxID=1872138 RepID=UPI002DDCDEC9|nr:helix-turn-helix transcriptional regulator [Actinophytocola sp.]HEV2782901.1 helix-turn-helix transcriptional regulator [Actinophytocola sp.]